MKKHKFTTGDIFAIPTSTGKFLFGRILFDVYRQCNQKGVNVLPGTCFDFFAGCFLIEVYEYLADEPIYQKSSVIIPGIFTSPTLFKKGIWPIVTHQAVNPQEVDFPEGLVVRDSAILFKKGELVFDTNLTYKDYERLNIYLSIESPYAIADIALHYSNRQHLIAPEDIQVEYLENSDLRYASMIRADIYKYLNQDPNQTYYKMSLKEGVDLARLY